MKKTLLTTLTATLLLGESFTLQSGWNLLGTNAEIQTSQILSNPTIKNVVIYTNGAYKATSKNEFSSIPAKSGFFVFAENATTLELETLDTSADLAKVDGDGVELPANASSWKILHIKDANLYVEMKNDYAVGQKYSRDEALSYCANLTVGNISGWRLSETNELTGIGSVYNKSKDFFYRVASGNHHTNSGISGIDGDYPTYSFILPALCVKDAQ